MQYLEYHSALNPNDEFQIESHHKKTYRLVDAHFDF